MKSNNKFVLKNKSNELIRVIHWDSGKLHIVRDKESGRLLFTNKLSSLEQQGLEIEKIKSINKSDVTQSGLSLGQFGVLSPLTGSESLGTAQTPTEENEDQLPLIFKWTSLGYIASICLLLLGTFISNRYFNDKPEEVVVTVTQQARTVSKTLNASKRKIQRKRISSKKKTPRKKVATVNSRSRRHRNAKRSYNKRASARNLHKVGALGALGGLNKKMRGAGGLDTKAQKNNAGLAYGGPAARGGHQRSLVGKGLIAAGAGNSKGLKGYGGYGTKGQGGGKPGYGSMKVGGSSSAFFQPLSEESLVDGGLDKDQINAVIQRNRGQVTYCYERGLQKDPSLRGRVEVKFVISPYGKVSAAKINNSSLGARQVENCIVNKLRRWKFPKPVGEVNVRVEYPFILKRLTRG